MNKKQQKNEKSELLNKENVRKNDAWHATTAWLQHKLNWSKCSKLNGKTLAVITSNCM